MTRGLLAALLIAGFAVTGCADNATDSGSPTTETATSRVVPAVQEPLNADGFLSDPCGLISEQEATDLGLPTSEADTLAGRVACKWRKDESDPAPLEVLRVQFLKDYGLAKISADCKTGCASWAVTEVDGYPALHANGPLESKYGMCRLYVAITDTRSLMVTDGDVDAMRQGATDGAAGGPKCVRAERAAALVIQKLKDGR